MEKIYTDNYGYLDIINIENSENYYIITAKDEFGLLYKGVTDLKKIEVICFSKNNIDIKPVLKKQNIIDTDFLVKKDDGFTYHYKLTPHDCVMTKIKMKNYFNIQNEIYKVQDENDQYAMYNINTGQLITPYSLFCSYNKELENFEFLDYIRILDQNYYLIGKAILDSRIITINFGDKQFQIDINNYSNFKSKLQLKLILNSFKKQLIGKTKVKK